MLPTDTRRLARVVLLSFVLTFIAARVVSLLTMTHHMPNVYLHVRGTHVHHLNYGIFLLAGVGAYLLFSEGPANLARAARQTGARLLQISTDYVFDGMATRPYREDDPVGPLNVYGRTKLAGEQAVQDLLPQSHLIVRTQWLFGEGAPNFVATILRLARERSELKVVRQCFFQLCNRESRDEVR